MGMIQGALGGLAEGLMRGAEYVGKFNMQQEAEKAVQQRMETLAALQHRYGQEDIRLKNELEQGPKREIGAAVSRYTDERRAAMNPVRNDDEGNPVPIAEPSVRDVSEFGAREAMRRGEVGIAKDYQAIGAPKAKALNAGDVLVDEQTGAPIADNMAGLDIKAANERKAAEYRQTQAKQLEEFKAKLRSDYRLNPTQATAMERNIAFMVENGIAEGPGAAFEKLRTGMAKSPAAATEQMVTALIRGDTRGQYRGKDGRLKAIADAKELVGAIREVDDLAEEGEALQRGYNNAAPWRPSGGARPAASYKSDTEVRDALRAGKIDRATAMRELQRFGYK